MASSANRLRVQVGSPGDRGRRFVAAWNRATAGKKVDETNVTFMDAKTLLETLSPRRLELLRYVRKHGARNVRDLSHSLARDYKNVHQDVTVLEAAGLLIRDGRALSAPWDEVQANLSLLED